MHGSGPNPSEDRRIGTVIRYCAPSIAQQVAERDYAMLARGVDQINKFIHISPPRAAFSRESLAFHDKICAVQSQIMMKGAKDGAGVLYG